MNPGEALERFQEDGVVLLHRLISSSLIDRLRRVAIDCFAAAEVSVSFASRYRFNHFSHSMQISAMTDQTLEDARIPRREMVYPLQDSTVRALIAEALGGDGMCALEHSWLRKKYAPRNAPDGRDVSQGWHQDGGLGVQFPERAGSHDERGYWISTAPMTELVTCWIPLEACGVDAPGLEFVRGQQPGLLHFTELADGDLRGRFTAERFWAPQMEPGDAVVFRNSVLHRTFQLPVMTRDRMSVEYRLFPA